MGYSTDFLGHIDIHPALNADEIGYLQAFCGVRHWDRAAGPYVVPGNPFLEEESGGPRYNRVGDGKPQLYCQWSVCWDGECLTWDGREKFYRPVEWLRYLLEHFLVPDAHARSSGLDCFRGFTFDHRADGIVIAHRRDTRELSAICVQDNAVTERILMPGDDDPRRRRPFAYEEEPDRWQAEVAASSTPGPGLHAV